MSRLVKFLTWLTTFAVIVLVELGDKTQIVTLLYSSSNPGKRWQVFVAAACAMVACVTLEVTAGVVLARHIPPSLLNRLAGFVFLGIGAFSLARLARERNPHRDESESRYVADARRPGQGGQGQGGQGR